MIVIPAVDVRGGRCVRLKQGRPENETVYSPDPVMMAKLWESKGARLLHMVDLDGAFTGSMKNMDIVIETARSLDIPLQAGGGIRDPETVRELIEGGVSRVILGTSAVKDRDFLKDLLERYPERISVGIDAVEGRVAVSGWQEVSSEEATELARGVEKMGVSEIIVTDIKKDGMMKGPGIKWIRKIARAVEIPVIAAGGISGIDDILALRDLGIENLKGVIVGKALYRDNNFLSEAIRVTREKN